MGNIIVCSGNLVPAKAGPSNIPGVLACDVPWEIVPYVEPTDTTAIYGQLVALNELDPTVISLLVAGSLALFITGFSTGIILKKLRQA